MKSVDEHPALMIRGGIHRAAHGVESAGAKPSFGGCEEGVRDLLVIPAFKESEEPDAVRMKLVVRAILDGGDSADGLPISDREKERTIGLSVKRVGFSVEGVAHGDAQGWYPFGVVGSVVDLPREIDKTAQIARRFD